MKGVQAAGWSRGRIDGLTGVCLQKVGFVWEKLGDLLRVCVDLRVAFALLRGSRSRMVIPSFTVS